jgi:hypothetical protein
MRPLLRQPCARAPPLHAAPPLYGPLAPGAPHRPPMAPAPPLSPPPPQVYTEENRMFIAKVLEMSGLSHTGTFVPNAIHPGLTDDPKTDMATSLVGCPGPP